MRAFRVALAVALIAPVLAAQMPVRHAAADVGALDVDLHYNYGADTWVSANKPAYIAVFDLSRTSATMIYPTFSAQAEHPIFNSQRIIGLPNSGFSTVGMFGGGTPLAYAMSGYGYRGGSTGSLGGWPHMLLLVASTSPLRVKNPWSTDLELNHVLVQRHFLNLQDEAGIKAIMDLIHPDDPTAEMAYDYVDAIPARQAQYAAYDGTYSALYDDLLRTCSNPRFVLTSVAGHDVTPICMPPIRTGPTGPVTPPKDTGTKATATPDMNRRAGESRLITDPNDIRRFIEENRRSDPNGIVKVQGAALTSQNGGQAARTPSGNSVNVNRREGDASQFHNAPKPATVDRPAVIDHSAAQQTHLTAPTPVAQPAQSAPHVSAAPSGSAPVKP